MEIRHLERPTLGLTLLGGLRIFAVNPYVQSKRLAALPALRKQQPHLLMAAAVQFFADVLPVQVLRDAIAHVPVKILAQRGGRL